VRVRPWIPVACAALLLAPAAAHAGFSSEPLLISGDSGDNLLPVTAADAEGSTMVVWREGAARDVPPRAPGRLARPDDDGLGRHHDPDPARRGVRPGGRALIVWTESTLGTEPRFLRARWIEADDSMGGQLTCATRASAPAP
jgi:hypothetical protein